MLGVASYRAYRRGLYAICPADVALSDGQAFQTSTSCEIVMQMQVVPWAIYDQLRIWILNGTSVSQLLATGVECKRFLV